MRAFPSPKSPPTRGDTIADAIIMRKREEARLAGAELKSSGVISGVDISPTDMCKILANLLDNAIEAVSGMEMEGELKVIDLDFRKTDNFFMISVTNPTEHEVTVKDGEIETGSRIRILRIRHQEHKECRLRLRWGTLLEVHPQTLRISI